MVYSYSPESGTGLILASAGWKEAVIAQATAGITSADRTCHDERLRVIAACYQAKGLLDFVWMDQREPLEWPIGSEAWY